MSGNQSADPSAPRAASAAEVGRLLASDPVAAEARAREILAVQTHNADARLVLAAALRRQARADEAEAILQPIVAAQPDHPFAQVELGLALGALGRRSAAFEALARAVDHAPTYINAWCALADELALQRDEADPKASGAEAEVTFRAADAAIARKDFSEAEALLARLLEAVPECEAARFRYAVVLIAQEKAHRALSLIDDLIRLDPANRFFRELRGCAFNEAGDFHQAVAEYEGLLADGRDRPGVWMAYGRALRSIGKEQECVAAFRKAVEILPAFAQAWRTLATVKTIRFAPGSVERLQALLARPDLLTSTRMQLHFALAKALEDAERYSEAFENYARSQALQGTGVSGTATKFGAFVGKLKTAFTPELFGARRGAGCADSGPIFVVGMPRAGSTLVQEILAAHSAVERTGELQDLHLIVGRLSNEAQRTGAPPFPDLLASLAPERLGAIGAEYLAVTRPRRRAGKPFFVDKHPQNFVNAGLIQLVLPRAKIIDVRRYPLDCCFSIFRNYLPSGPQWSHDLAEIGRYYAAYVELMAHWDAVLPGSVHRLIYEDLVAEPEREVRRLLDFLGLPFEQECLRFYEKEQAIVTMSVEQARRPIYESGIGNSRVYEPWLGPLKAALGDVLDAWPAAPKYFAPLKASFSMRLA